MADELDRIIAEVRTLVRELERVNIRVRQAILFGSRARGDHTQTSDIDIALVSDDFEGIRLRDKSRLNPALIHHDPRLEIHPYRTDEFNPESRWFVEEVLKTGVPIPLH